MFKFARNYCYIIFAHIYTLQKGCLHCICSLYVLHYNIALHCRFLFYPGFFHLYMHFGDIH